jgi:hypothetical protein
MDEGRRPVMQVPRTDFIMRCAIRTAAMFALGTVTTVYAQEDAEEDEVIDEIVVTAGKKSGDPVDVDALYDEMMRDRLMIDLDRLNVLEEQNEWRSSANTIVARPSRIQWGYKPQDDVRMGRESNLSDVPFITTKPASLFQFEF